ncbi:phosphatase PAP2 family protein [Arthrobacter sp. AL12]|uniref:phosphatase PAP2 family protein n=1 Tax=Arthrobacter sp. AL12 TaxID=3042241 RepID=UPI00249BE24D|nr:phosphatase PAP2 family protein [Arthrobacter sp. AL12]MDI3212876.1 phosphatase PAP2 family protein [Arthrobacter sp. AL12]
MTRVLDPQRLPPGSVLAASTALLTLGAVLGGLLLADVRTPPFQALDEGWGRWIASLRSPFWDGLNVVLNLAGYRGALVVHGLLVAALLLRRRTTMALFAAAAGLAVLGCTQILKAGIFRERPDNTVVLTDTGSFPSGHVASTAAFLVVMALLVGRAWAAVLAGLGVLTMMVSRTYLSAHWLVDTVGSVCLAVPVVLLLWLVFQDICIQENTDARRLLSWRARASRRRRAEEHPGSGS